MVGPELVGVVNRALEAGQAAAAAAYATAATTAPPTELGALADAVGRALGGDAALAAAPHVARLCLPPPWAAAAAARRVNDALAAARLPPWPASAHALEDYLPMALGALAAPVRMQAMARPPLSVLVACGLLAQAAADRVAAALRGQPPVLWQATPALAALRAAPPDGLAAVLATLAAPAGGTAPAGTPKRRLRQYGPRCRPVHRPRSRRLLTKRGRRTAALPFPTAGPARRAGSVCRHTRRTRRPAWPRSCGTSWPPPLLRSGHGGPRSISWLRRLSASPPQSSLYRCTRVLLL